MSVDLDAPYGLRPVKHMNGMPWSGAVRRIKIASEYGTDIFNGDVVSLAAGGTIEKVTGTTSFSNAIGVFLGVESSSGDALNYLLHRQMWESGTKADDAMAYVADDPFTLFQIRCDDSISQDVIGSNFGVNQGSGDSATGKSGVGLDVSTGNSTNTLPLRVIDIVPGTLDNDYPEVLVKFNTHMYLSGTGRSYSP